VSVQSILESVRRLVQNPTSNLAATSLGFAIVVVIILILIMIALIALVPKTGSRGHAGERGDTGASSGGGTPARTRRGLRLRTLTGMERAVIIALLAIVATTATYITSGTTGYCASTCHTMLEAGDSWATSAHSATACVRCHEDSIADAVFTRARHAVAELTGSSGFALRGSVSSRRCLDCHANVLETTITTARGVRVEHGHIVAAGTDCMRCHESAGHTDGSPTRRGTMSDCLRCHDGKQALAGCFICHTGDVARATLSERTFGKTRLPTPQCGGCHEQDACDDCHGLRMPHPDNYADPRQHARAGAFDGRKTLCYRCHTKQDCGRCHLGLDTGHPVGWKNAHKESPPSQGSGYCVSCHKTKDFCEVCHP